MLMKARLVAPVAATSDNRPVSRTSLSMALECKAGSACAVTQVTQAATAVADSLTIKAAECGRWVVT
jgi:hypothetical protein